MQKDAKHGILKYLIDLSWSFIYEFDSLIPEPHAAKKHFLLMSGSIVLPPSALLIRQKSIKQTYFEPILLHSLSCLKEGDILFKINIFLSILVIFFR